MPNARKLEEIEVAAEEFPPEVKETIDEILRRPPVEEFSSKIERETRINQIRSYEVEVSKALRSISSEVEFDVEQEGVIRRLDALVTFKGKKIAIDIRFDTGDKHSTQKLELGFAILGSDDDHKLDGIILVTNHVSRRSRDLASGHRRFVLVQWLSTNDNEALRSALEKFAAE